MPRPECPAENSAAVEETTFFSKDGINWTPHTIGWSVAGGCAILVCLSTPINLLAYPQASLFTQTLLISLVSVLKHCRCVVLVIAPVALSHLIPRIPNIETIQTLLSNARCTTTSCRVSSSSDLPLEPR